MPGTIFDEHDFFPQTDLFDAQLDGFDSEPDARRVTVLAGELLTRSTDAEIDRFLSDLVSSAGGARRPRSLLHGLKAVGRAAIPALRRFAVDPGVIAQGPLGGVASALTSGISTTNEIGGRDHEFEVAQRFVRLARRVAEGSPGVPRDANAGAKAIDAIRRAAAELGFDVDPGEPVDEIFHA